MFAMLYLPTYGELIHRIISSRVPTCWGRNTCRRTLNTTGNRYKMNIRGIGKIFTRSYIVVYINFHSIEINDIRQIFNLASRIYRKIIAQTYDNIIK